VIVSSNDDEAGIVNAGSVRLMDGGTGLQIGSTLSGDIANDQFGSYGITELGNGNFVIKSPGDDEDGLVDAGSVRIINSSTGIQEGIPIIGAITNDMSSIQVVDSISGDYFILSQRNADKDGLVDSGQVRIVTP